jgi:hypothetical protein
MHVEQGRSLQISHATSCDLPMRMMESLGTILGQDCPNVDAPSVLSPEIVIPSAGAFGATLQSLTYITVLVPESLPGRLLLRHW